MGCEPLLTVPRTTAVVLSSRYRIGHIRPPCSRLTLRQPAQERGLLPSVVEESVPLTADMPVVERSRRRHRAVASVTFPVKVDVVIRTAFAVSPEPIDAMVRQIEQTAPLVDMPIPPKLPPA